MTLETSARRLQKTLDGMEPDIRERLTLDSLRIIAASFLDPGKSTTHLANSLEVPLSTLHERVWWLAGEEVAGRAKPLENPLLMKKPNPKTGRGTYWYVTERGKELLAELTGIKDPVEQLSIRY